MSGIENEGARKVGSAIRNLACLTRVAESQNHVITTAQLKACGLSKAAINRRVRDVRLHPKHRGVYAVGRPDLSQAGVFHAAVLAVGDDGLLSHSSTAVNCGFWPYRGNLDVVEVSVPRRGIPDSSSKVDGDTFHKTRYRRKKDARKQAIVEAAGLRVIRLVPDDVEPENETQTVARLGHAIPDE
jgi:Transcriptional regulator, AbiEi antitoxin